MSQLPYLVVPTTHWDRAWYWTADRFRTRLVAMFAGVEHLWKSDPEWCFTLDGQTIALEDYLEVFPENPSCIGAWAQLVVCAWGRFMCRMIGGAPVQNH